MLAYRKSLCYNLQGSTWKKRIFREKSHVLTYRPVPDLVVCKNDTHGRKQNHGGKKMSVISMKQLLEAGVHFGHQTRRWNPKMAPYIYTERNGIYIIDLQKSVGKVDEAYKAMSDIAAEGGTILFVGTKMLSNLKQSVVECSM
jgi:hypothetical protein